jgi:hypothetical protein
MTNRIDSEKFSKAVTQFCADQLTEDKSGRSSRSSRTEKHPISYTSYDSYEKYNK